MIYDRYTAVKQPLTLFLATLVFTIWLTSTSGVKATTLTVTSMADSGTGTLREAITTATAGDVIQFDPSLSDNTITLTSGQLLINKNLTIEGLGAHRLTISGDNNSRIFQISGAIVTVVDLTLTNGSANDGGAIEIDQNGNLTLERVRIQNSVATTFFGEGGGIRNRGALTIRNSTINNNAAAFGAGLHHEGSLANLTNVTFSTNNGTAVYADDFAVSGVSVINLILSHVTITGSAAGLGANSSSIPTSVTSINTLIADNAVNCGFGPTIALNMVNSYDSDGTCTGATQSSMIDLSATLADNGGSTPTHQLMDSSALIDVIPTGTYCSGSGSDQRGGIRGNGAEQGDAGCEPGAYEATYTFVQNVDRNKFYRLHQADLQLTTIGSLSQLTAVYHPSPHPNATGSGASGAGLTEYWELSNIGTGFTTILTLPHSNAANPQICKYPGGLGGGGWDCAVNSSTTSTATRNGITSFSDWAIGANVTPTAVQLQHSTTSPVAPSRIFLWIAITLAIPTYIRVVGQRKKHHSNSRINSSGKTI